jgi:hypothetical protein
MEGQSVLRCGQCNKPFDKGKVITCLQYPVMPSLCLQEVEATLKRHGYYCRSQKNGHTTRPRSCLSCAKGKARCDHQRPKCSRCMTKGIECHYPANKGKGKQPRSPQIETHPTGYQDAAPLLVVDSVIESGQETTDNNDVVLDQTSNAFPALDLPDIGELYPTWNDPAFNFVDFLTPQESVETIQWPSPSSSSLVHHSTPTPDQIVQIQQASYVLNSSIPVMSMSTLRTLIQRPKMKTGRIATLTMHTLKSYPLMMLRHNTLPPFIHPHLISSGVHEKDLEPLTNCISLVHMISSGVQGSRKLFWRNVRVECERLCSEVRCVTRHSKETEVLMKVAFDVEQMGTSYCYAGAFDIYSHQTK